MLENGILKIGRNLRNRMMKNKWTEVLCQLSSKGLKLKPNRKYGIVNGMLSIVKMMRIFQNMPLDLRKFTKK